MVGRLHDCRTVFAAIEEVGRCCGNRGRRIAALGLEDDCGLKPQCLKLFSDQPLMGLASHDNWPPDTCTPQPEHGLLKTG